MAARYMKLSKILSSIIFIFRFVFIFVFMCAWGREQEAGGIMQQLIIIIKGLMDGKLWFQYSESVADIFSLTINGLITWICYWCNISKIWKLVFLEFYHKLCHFFKKLIWLLLLLLTPVKTQEKIPVSPLRQYITLWNARHVSIITTIFTYEC